MKKKEYIFIKIIKKGCDKKNNILEIESSYILSKIFKLKGGNLK